MEKRTEDFVKATEKVNNRFGTEKLETARGLAGMHRYLVNSFFGKFASLVFLPNAMMIDALKEKGEWGDNMIEG